jgi:copper homeostasis protein (lipoprotein)
MAGWNRVRALATALACCVGVYGTAEAQVRGMALVRERVTLPADAVFEATLEDVTRGDEPGSALGHTRIEKPGNPPIRFSIDYDPSRIDPRHLYRVRARIIVGSRQRFVADHSDLVLTWGHGHRVSLLLHRSNAPYTPERDVARNEPSRSEPPRGELAGSDAARSEVSHGEVAHDDVSRAERSRSENAGSESARGAASRDARAFGSDAAIFTGNLPCADCTAVRHQLDLFPNGSYFLRRAYLGKGRDAYVDEIGRWTLSRDGSTLTLKGSRDSALRIAIGKPDTLHVLAGASKTRVSSRSNTLALTNRAPPLEPRLEMRGMFMYMADAGRFTECSTHQSWPVAKEGDNAALESAYSRARRRDADEVLVRVVGRVAMRPRMEGGGRERTLVVERFVDASPGERCTGSAPKGSNASNAPLENTYWKLTSLENRPVAMRAGQQEPYLMLNAETGRMSGWAGCSGVSGRFKANGESLTFNTLMTMRSACAAKGVDLERRYLTALRRASRARVTRQRLELLDARGKSLARFEAGRRGD